MNILRDSHCKEWVMSTEIDESEFTQVEAARAIDNILCRHGLRQLLDYVAWACVGRINSSKEFKEQH
jgi:hypothetical protein